MRANSLTVSSIAEGSTVRISSEESATVTVEVRDKVGLLKEILTQELIGKRNVSTAVDLHSKIVDILIETFVPHSKEMDMANNNLIRRGVSSTVEDILRLVEDHYGVTA